MLVAKYYNTAHHNKFTQTKFRVKRLTHQNHIPLVTNTGGVIVTHKHLGLTHACRQITTCQETSQTIETQSSRTHHFCDSHAFTRSPLEGSQDQIQTHRIDTSETQQTTFSHNNFTTCVSFVFRQSRPMPIHLRSL